MKKLFVICLLLVLPLAANAGSKIGTPIYKSAPQLNVVAGNVPAQVDTIELAITTQQFEELTGLERADLSSNILLIEKEGISADEALKSQDIINQILVTAFQNSKMICKFEPVMGSNMKQKQCQTFAERNARIKQTQLDLKRGHYLPQAGAPATY